ncbi:NTP/NDP exchange transporter [Engelhardtia mirabilis]|uniref:TLC ATP/ADP transporter n=1 Tax=Engelhardtia mirabilis TaxID=2528011 RepID=A0A518BET3_9BACT|nr:TLC ATP/ADP transporter [Planctomycetes bacterium Pla133]QDU99824.1 TLC ATP/ADP transporter [Planctomycetes bacterium Pla86]
MTPPSNATGADAEPDRAPRGLLGLFGVDRSDGPLLLGLASMHFLVLCAYYAARPLRDEVGANIASELGNLWTAVFFVNLVLSPLYAAFARAETRRRLMGGVFLFFALCAVLFSAGLGGLRLGDFGPTGLEGSGRLWLERVFYVWLSVFVMLVVSSFWSYASDLCDLKRAKRLYGVVAAAGTVGGIVGARLTGELSSMGIGPGRILLIVAGLLVAASFNVGVVERRAERDATGPANSREAIGGTIWSGFQAVVRSRYMLAIVGFILLMTLSSTIFYYIQSNLVREVIADRGERRAYLASLDEITNWITLVGQLGVVGWMMKRLGVGLTLAGLPLVALLGMIAVGFAFAEGGPLMALASAFVHFIQSILGGEVIGDWRSDATLLTILSVVLVAQRAARYAFARPSRETLYTLVSRDERFKSKNFIDTVVYRGGDVTFGRTFTWLSVGLGYSVGAIALMAAPIMVLWIGLSIWLGALAGRRSPAGD